MKQGIAKKPSFGTAPVFMATISTILGAILFLRFGYAVGHVGFWGTIGIIIFGHIITFTTALAVAEIATNQKVEGGGAYYIISRSFGLNIGASIGIALFLAQAISVAFYIIAFAEAFEPALVWIYDNYNIVIEKRVVALVSTGLVTFLILLRGAKVGVGILYVVVFVLFISLIMFFAGSTDYVPTANRFFEKVENSDNFFYVFTIIFPAFTGIAAGLGLSGDLKNPKKSIPLGTLSATLAGMIIYVAIAIKLTISASSEDLANDQLIMSRIAIWGPIIPIGLACATISSALGSMLIAPRTLQALGADKVLPGQSMNEVFAKTRKKDNEPIIAGFITCGIALVFVLIGDINFVAEIISMFFMVTYGAICLISFLEHFAANPSYRPSFRSKWYFSLIGVILSVWLMFKMNPSYALLSLAIMLGIYFFVTYFSSTKSELSNVFRGVMFQASRRLHVYLQRKDREHNRVTDPSWRPAVVCISSDSFQRISAFELLRWISDKHGFATYLHYIKGYLSKSTHEEARTIQTRLISTAAISKSKVLFDTIISPSYTSAIAQTIQLPGVTGKDNNMILFEYQKDKPEMLNDVIENYSLINSVGFDLAILATSDRGFGYTREMHIWITSADYENANLMILLGFIMLGHEDWQGGVIRIFVVVPEGEEETRREEINNLIKEGRLQISRIHVNILVQSETVETKSLIVENSQDADLTIVGFRKEILKRNGLEFFGGFDGNGNVLFVNTTREKEII